MNKLQTLKQFHESQLITKQNEIAKIQTLKEKCSKFPELFKNNITNENQLKKENKELTGQLLEIQQKHYDAEEEIYALNQKLNYEQEDLNNFKFSDLDNFSCLLGYRLVDCNNLDDEVIKYKVYYNDTYYVTISINNGYDVLEIYPEHPNFPNIKNFLSESQNIQGLLACLRKYFEIHTNL